MAWTPAEARRPLADTTGAIQRSRKERNPVMTQRTALIIGAAGGICSELSRQLADKGERLVLFDRDEAAGKALAAQLTGATDVEVIVGDILDVPETERQLGLLTRRWTPSLLLYR